MFLMTNLIDTLERIISDFLGYIREFESFNIRSSHPREPDGVDHFPVNFSAETIYEVTLFS